MPRRARITKRKIAPDVRYQNVTISRLINRIMTCGKKSTAERIVYDALDIVAEQVKGDPLATLELAIRNATPILEV